MSEKILMIETSTECCSVALSDGGRILAAKTDETPRVQSSMLVPYIEEVLQAAKYVPYLEMILGPRTEIIPALVLTGSRDFFDFVPIGETEGVLAACSGDMIFNVLNEYLGFLRE